MISTHAQEAFSILLSLMSNLYRELENSMQTQDSGIESEQEQLKTHLMQTISALCKLLWDFKKFDQMEKVLMRASKILGTSEHHKVLVGHLYYAQKRFPEAAIIYESIISSYVAEKSTLGDIEQVRGLYCTCLILTNQQSIVEKYLGTITNDSSLLLTNVYISALYCNSNNYEYGLSRLVSSIAQIRIVFENPFIWLNIKKLLAMALNRVALGLFSINDDLAQLLVQFLRACVDTGKEVRTVGDVHDYVGKTVSEEAELIFKALTQLLE